MKWDYSMMPFLPQGRKERRKGSNTLPQGRKGDISGDVL
ncbi:hypothetical protein LTSESEN_1385 [Salmonella enterica subsp. enterica serovar Senftenberg str. A4-543]|uniref:Uncharacterized protein n=1 Tax=Salmonella enterica subsp. enterica serovar Senftenberg str. A4-543 TaxID=913082 RepID=G5QX94_SALSE|nr:hypothetical protein LTSESEN_1385 [Salmonella enterica subsp. enterica serovar Senftenberg str. A4-543]